MLISQQARLQSGARGFFFGNLFTRQSAAERRRSENIYLFEIKESFFLFSQQSDDRVSRYDNLNEVIWLILRRFCISRLSMRCEGEKHFRVEISS